MKELMTQQNNGNGNNINTEEQPQQELQVAKNSRIARRKELENALKNPRSLISIDGLLDGITALVLDCEPMRKNKNIENFLNRCKYEKFFLQTCLI
jgi:hypothetical protein